MECSHDPRIDDVAVVCDPFGRSGLDLGLGVGARVDGDGLNRDRKRIQFESSSKEGGRGVGGQELLFGLFAF